MDSRYKTGAERKTAVERREAVLGVAMSEFALRGLHGASTERVAKGADIAHSYVFKLFGTKKDLFVAATEHVYDLVLDLFRQGAEGHREDPLWGMGDAFGDLLERREELLVMIHGFAAAGDPEIGDVVRRRYVGLYRYARETSGVSPERMKAFWSHGMLMIVAAAINLPSLETNEGWVKDLLNMQD